MYYRDHPRPAPYPVIAATIGALDSLNGLDDLRWKVVTGYHGHDADGPRREYAPSRGRPWRVGRWWHPREDAALRAALTGEGQRRKPPVDVDYIAAVLARTPVEVAARWDAIKDPLRRGGFGFGA